MTTAREVMYFGVECLSVDETLTTAAERMAALDVGAMPVCEGERLRGIITDRDIVVKVIAQGRDPSEFTAGSLIGSGPVWTAQTDTDVDEILHDMIEHKIRRVPVLEDDRLVGIISQADLAANLPDDKVGELVEAVSSTAH